MTDYYSDADKRYDLQNFLFETSGDSLPPESTIDDVRVLWRVANRMQNLQHMMNIMETEGNDDSELYLFVKAIYDDDQLIFFAFLHAIGKHADTYERYRKALNEKNAQRNVRDIDDLYAHTGD